MTYAATIASLLGILLGIATVVHQIATPLHSAGAVTPSATPIFDTVLTQQLGTSDTTMYLKTVTDNQGNVLAGTQCFTVDVNTSIVEYVCGTVSGTTVTGLTRNLNYQTGTTTYATPTNIHRVGADVRITDFPALTVLSNQANGKDTFASPLLYAAHPCSVSSSSTTICDKNYIDTSTTAGAAAGNATTAGILMTATALQAASSTGTGVFNAVTYNRALWASYATDTPQNCSTAANGGCVVMSLLNGKLNQAWLDLTQGFTWTGLHNFNGQASTTQFSIQGTNAQLFIGGAATTSIQGATTGTSTIQGFISIAGTNSTSTVSGNLAISHNATTTGLTISGMCTGCLNGYEQDTTTGNYDGGTPAMSTLTVTCTGTKKVIAGGRSGLGNNDTIVASYPAASNQWTTTARASSNGSSGSAGTSYAICVNP